jgi:coenzyme F420-reducing hydrogenase delta subunit
MRCAEEEQTVPAASVVTAFICANCAPGGRTSGSGGDSNGKTDGFGWPFPVQEILVPCAGRLQPEHVLKAFEAGADLVLTVSCEEEHCLYLQGSERWARRADHVRSLLDEIGLGGERLVVQHLPGSPAGHMGLRPLQTTTPDAATSQASAGSQDRLAALREAVSAVARTIDPNPLCTLRVDEEIEETYQPLDMSDEDNNE